MRATTTAARLACPWCGGHLSHIPLTTTATARRRGANGAALETAVACDRCEYAESWTLYMRAAARQEKDHEEADDHRA